MPFTCKPFVALSFRNVLQQICAPSVGLPRPAGSAAPSWAPSSAHESAHQPKASVHAVGSLQSLRRFGALLLVCGLFLAASASASAQMSYNEFTSVSGGGTLSWTVVPQTGDCNNNWYYIVDDMFTNFVYTPKGYTPGGVHDVGLGGSIYYINGCDAGYYTVLSGWNQPGGTDNELSLSYGQYCTIDYYASDYGSGSASLDCLATQTTSFYPDYKIASILYAPPGGQSQQGLTNTTTNGTTSTVADTFTGSVEYSFSGGFLDGILGPGGGAQWGYSLGSTNTNQFTQQWITAQGITTFANKSSYYNPSKSDALNPLLDTFEIWLNPQVDFTTTTDESNPTILSYNVHSQPVTLDGVTEYQADMIPIVAETIQAQPAGVTPFNPSGVAGGSAVPIGLLVPQALPQETGGTADVFQPGMGAICASNYAYQVALQEDNSSGVAGNGECTQANQCGCQPSDFSNIMQQDLLLGYNTSNFTASPENGTVGPLSYDWTGTSSGPGSGPTVCGEDQQPGYQIPTNSNCRYVIVPQSGTNIPITIQMNGAVTQSYTRTDQFAQSYTSTATSSTNVGFSVSNGFLMGKLKVQDTFTWTDSEGIGTSTGGSNTINTSLGANGGCSEAVALYEDTIYHTFVYQIPTGNTNCQ